jgi:hypothetical protein
MTNIVMYSFFAALLFWVQLKLMKKTAQMKEYVTVGLILILSTVVGLCMTMGFQIMSPSMILQKWISIFVK